MGERVSTRELGLILGTRLLKTRDLHYGFWSADLPVRIANLPEAQRRYSEFVLSRIPQGVRTILDVGAGTGALAAQLTERGYSVECISPSPELTRLCRERLAEAVPIHECTFEAYAGPGPFDLVLFAESFQYIPLQASLPKCAALLASGGHVLVADFFRKPNPAPSALSGGHDLERFHEMLVELPFQVVSDEDITEQTAPNLDLVDELITDYGRPIYDAAGYYLRHRFPRLARLGWRLFRRRLERVEFKYFSHQRSAEAFKQHKSYRVALLRRTGAAPAAGAAGASGQQ